MEPALENPPEPEPEKPKVAELVLRASKVDDLEALRLIVGEHSALQHRTLQRQVQVAVTVLVRLLHSLADLAEHAGHRAHPRGGRSHRHLCFQ